MHSLLTETEARSRRWRVPPPLTRGAELLEGSEILTEVAGDRGLLLWKSLHSVSLWADTPSHEQGGLFCDGAHRQRLADLASTAVDDTLLEPLQTLAAVLQPMPAPDRTRLALACRRIAQWADRNGASATALAFVQAAALVCPADAALAYAVGRAARLRAENARSESWYRRAIMLGRQSGDWESYSLAYSGLGNLFVQRGNLPAAHRCFVKTLRASRRRSLHEAQGFALQGLLGLAIEAGDATAVHDHAQAALHAFGTGHPHLPTLAHDVACFWMSQGQFQRAAEVFHAVLPHFPAAPERAVVWANLARASAGALDNATYDQACAAVFTLLDRPETPSTAAQALLNLARGAVSLGRWETAEQTARDALAIAIRREEAQCRFEAEAVLDSARTGRDLELAAPAPAAPSSASQSRLAEELLLALPALA